MPVTQSNCTACGACVSICPRGCIKLQKNEYGFYMPVTDSEACTDCGLCRKICPVNNRPSGNCWEDGTYYALWALEDSQRLAGSSGGAFGLLAEQVLKAGGVVFGAAYSGDHRCVYQTSTDGAALNALKKSKYVESFTGAVFTDVKSALETGRQVLYCGTACQIDGLKNYLGRSYSNLLTCDLLCHGVPSAGIYEKYIRNLESRYGPVTGVDFRSKAHGWKTYCTKVTFASGHLYLKNRFRDPWLRLFFEDNILRDCCYHCRRLHRSNADITLGDFWRAAVTEGIPDTDDGISLVGIHTEIGQQAVDALLTQKLCFAQRLLKNSYAYAYSKDRQMPKDRTAQLQRITAATDLFRLHVPLRTRIRGYLYSLRSTARNVLKPK